MSLIGTVVLGLTAVSWPSATADEPQADTAMMLVMDASGSMAEKTGGGTTRIRAAKDGLNAVIDGLPDEQRVGFRVYGASDVAEDDPAACTDSKRIVDLDTDNRDALRKAVADYEPVGWTPTSHALREAAKDLGTPASARSCSSPTASRRATPTRASSRARSRRTASTCASTSSASTSRAARRRRCSASPTPAAARTTTRTTPRA